MTEIDVEAVESIDDGNGGGIEAPEYVLYGGKGGVGKTTMAAATALASAREGAPTLVVSTDPAHSLSDVLDRDVPAEPALVHPEYPLYGVEIDPDDSGDEDGFFGIGLPLAGIGPFGGGSPKSDRSDGSDDSAGASMPGTDEAAALRALLRYLDDDRFERVVVDTAPTGHTLRLLELPDRLDAALDRVLSVRERLEGMFSDLSGLGDDGGFGGFPGFGGAGGIGGDDDDGVFDVSSGRASGLGDLHEFRDRLETLERAFSDPERTDFRIVMVPEKTSVVESRRLLDRLEAFDIPVETIVVNRVMESVETVLGVESKPTTETGKSDDGRSTGTNHSGHASGEAEASEAEDESGDADEDDEEFVAPHPESCPFCRHRLRSQMDALGDADDLFRGRAVKRVPLLAAEVRGERPLGVVAACLA